MRVFSVIAENYEKALRRAKEQHGENIQVLYQKDVLYGIFAKRWVEIGYCVKTYGALKINTLFQEDNYYFSQYIKKESERLRDELLDMDYSYKFINDILDIFVSNRLDAKKKYTTIENDEFIYKTIASCVKYDFDTYSQMPEVMCLMSVYGINRERVIKNIVSHYLGSKTTQNENNPVINLINVSQDGVSPQMSGYTYMCENTSGILSIISNMKDYSNIIINLGPKYFYDEEFYRILEDVKATLGTEKVSSHFILPFYVRNTDYKYISSNIENIKSIIVSDYREDGGFGNIISISHLLDKQILFFENAQGVKLPSAFSIMQKYTR